jgi:SAM-dependent methyltransferase
MYSSFDYWQRNCFHQKIFNIGNQEEFKDFLGIRVRKLNELKVFPDREVNGKKASMIEVGCSEGSLLKYFYDRGCKVTGLDINAEIIKKASELYVFPFIAGNFLEHNFGENSYDLVISFHVLEHLTDVARAVEKFYQILNSGGKVVVEVPFGPEEYDNLEHFHFFSIESARCLFEKCFKNIEIRESDYLTASNIKCGAYYLVAEKSDK